MSTWWCRSGYATHQRHSRRPWTTCSAPFSVGSSLFFLMIYWFTSVDTIFRRKSGWLGRADRQ
jgi:hypothetical protein